MLLNLIKLLLSWSLGFKFKVKVLNYRLLGIYNFNVRTISVPQNLLICKIGNNYFYKYFFNFHVQFRNVNLLPKDVQKMKSIGKLLLTGNKRLTSEKSLIKETKKKRYIVTRLLPVGFFIQLSLVEKET